MFNVKNHKPEKIPRAMPTLRPDGEQQQSPVQYASRSRRLSEEAALAAQHVLDMEHELKGVTDARDEERIEREVADRENARLRDDIGRLTAQYEDRIKVLSADRDYHRERHVEIATRLDSVCAMLVDEAKHPKPEPAPAPPTNMEEEIAALLATEAPRQ